MIKELFLALVLGALLGFGITGTYLAVKKTSPNSNVTSISPSPSPLITNLPSPTKAITQPTKHEIIINSPHHESISSTSQIELKGSTSANSSVIITTTTETFYLNSDNDGNFNQKITLDSGINLIQIDSINEQEEIATSQILITYSTAKF